MTQKQEIVTISKQDNESVSHLLTLPEQWAIRAAVAANRPLLVEGEPGTGKTQLAIAAATWLERKFLSMTVDSKSESRDALWTLDSLQRLAHAQLLAALGIGKSPGDSPTDARQQIETELALRRFVRPGPMWWALNWSEAKKQLGSKEMPPGGTVANWDENTGGMVVLIDEIDKADRDFPNGLLEVFGSRQFQPPGFSDPIIADSCREAPLMIITTNHERELPSAFERRCLKFVLKVPDVLSPRGQDLPKDEQEKFISYLTDRGQIHFPNFDLELCRTAARKIMEFRIDGLKKQQSQKSGLAEYLDLLRTLSNLASEAPDLVLQKVGELFRK